MTVQKLSEYFNTAETKDMIMIILPKVFLQVIYEAAACNRKWNCIEMCWRYFFTISKNDHFLFCFNSCMDLTLDRSLDLFF